MTELSFPLHLGALLADVALSAFAVYLLKTKAPSVDNTGTELLAGTAVGYAANLLILSNGTTNLLLAHAIAGAFIGTGFYSLFVQGLADIIIWWWTHEGGM